MTNDALMNEFIAVREGVIDDLRLGKLAGRRVPFAICQLLVMSSFENWIAWDVILKVSQQSGLQTRLYRTSWRHDTDAAAFDKPMERARHPYPYPPTFEVGWLVVDRGRVEGILARLEKTTVPLGAAQEYTTCDGTSYEFAFGRHNASVRLAWHHELPQGWQAVQPVIDELLLVFNETWEAQGATASTSS